MLLAELWKGKTALRNLPFSFLKVSVNQDGFCVFQDCQSERPDFHPIQHRRHQNHSFQDGLNLLTFDFFTLINFVHFGFVHHGLKT